MLGGGCGRLSEQTLGPRNISVMFLYWDWSYSPSGNTSSLCPAAPREPLILAAWEQLQLAVP